MVLADGVKHSFQFVANPSVSKSRLWQLYAPDDADRCTLTGFVVRAGPGRTAAGARQGCAVKSTDALRLRAAPLMRPMHVVLVDPEIPQNTGNIARLCAATQSHLHLVGTLGFRIDDKAVRRAGLDYWHLVKLHRHLDLASFRHANPSSRCFFLTAKARRSYVAAEFQPGDALVFGRESVGLPEDLINDHADDTLAIPTLGAVRSLNVANAASIVLYEALRQVGALESSFMG